MRLFLVVRASIPWDKLDYKSYQTRAGYFAGRWMYRVNISLGAWRKMFDMSFFEYRAKVFDVAKSNWDKIEGLDDVLISDGSHRKTLEIINKLKSIKDAIILPIDDDDWADPGIKEKLAPYCHHPIIHWLQGSYDPYAGRDACLTLRKAAPFHFFTNNYAYSPFVYSFVNEFNQAEMTLMHLHFNDIIMREAYDSIRCNWVTLNKCFGVTNKTLASLSKLNKKNSMAHFVNCIRRHKVMSREPEGLHTTMRHCPWAANYIRKTEELHNELRESLKWNLRYISDTTAEKSSPTTSANTASNSEQVSRLP